MDYLGPSGAPDRARSDPGGQNEQEGSKEMIRNLKALGLSLVALFAMGALGASTASAIDVLTVGSSPALLTGVGHDHVFHMYPNGSKFECTTSRFAATVTNGASQATADVIYEGTLNKTPDEVHCNSTLGTITVDTAGCGYILNGDTTGELVAGGGKDATVWIECEGTNKIKITSSAGPVISIGSQTPTKGGVTFANVTHEGGTTHAVKVTATVTGVTYTCAPTFTCTLGGVSHHGNNSTYNGTVTMTAFEDKEGLPTPVSEGARTPLTWS
jgi:hypothetical protein